MEVAITLLILVAIASIIGTVIQQNQPYIDYTLKFGSFWFEAFRWFGLYDMYSQFWFLSIFTFLTISTSACVLRNGYPFLKQILRQTREQSIAELKHKTSFFEIELRDGNNHLSIILQKISKLTSYKPRLLTSSEHNKKLWLASRGRYQKLGYFFTHIGVIVICVGTVADSSLILKFKELMGDLTYETRDIELRNIPKSAWLSKDSANFRGMVSIPEGKSSNVVFLPWKDGYLIQELPFIISLLDFRIKHYSTGQPKSFESDLEVYNPSGDLIATKTISVNHPLTLDNLTIYQSSFEDGGSVLDLRLFDLLSGDQSTLQIAVNQQHSLKQLKETITLEIVDFRLFNIQPLKHSPNKFRNQGPSFFYKIRNESGQAIQYQNYMNPIIKDGRAFFVSGIQLTPADSFKYLHIPADDNLSLQRFIRLNNWFNNENKLQQILNKADFITDSDTTGKIDAKFLSTLLLSFKKYGIRPIKEYSTSIDAPKQREKFEKKLLYLLHLSFTEVYFTLLEETEGINRNLGASPKQLQFLDDVFISMNALNEYGYPLFFSLENFKHIQSSGLQITRSSAKEWVYLGCLMLIVGIFIMFYVPKRRLWISHTIDSLEVSRLIIAIEDNKQSDQARQDLASIHDIVNDI